MNTNVGGIKPKRARGRPRRRFIVRGGEAYELVCVVLNKKVHIIGVALDIQADSFVINEGVGISALLSRRKGADNG